MNPFRFIGSDAPRPDAPAKAAGKAVYIHDLQRPGMLYGKIKFSRHAHARITHIDTSAAERLPGVRAVITGYNTPEIRIGFIKDNFVLKRDKVRQFRDEVAAVAATDPDVAEEAVDLIRVEYEELPAVFDPEDALKTILDLASERIPKRFGFDPIDDIQVLTPMHKGSVGAGNLNTELQKILNTEKEGLIRGVRNFKVNDKVMQIKNNYDKEVFNGDIGRIRLIDAENQEVMISFDGRDVPYDYTDLDEIVLAYAVSIHKSQGSEYPAVIMPILTQHYVLLQRNLVYTGVTRGRKLVVMVGMKRALAIGVKNDKTHKRYTHLKERLSPFPSFGY